MTRVGQRSAKSHELRPPGATPGPATAEYANWQSDQVESLVILQVRLLPRSLTHGPVVQWRRRLRDVQESAGSIPAGITRRSVGVPVAHLLGKEGDRVRFPDGPLDQWAARSMGGRLVCTQVIGVRLPGGPLTGPWSNGKTPVRHTGNPGSIPGGSTETEGSRIRVAGPHC